MKIWQADEFGDPGSVLQQVDIDPPQISNNGYKLRILASGVGLPDYFMTKGTYPLVPKPPVSPGQEVVGIVTEVGGNCSFAVGDRVMTTTQFSRGWGGFAEELVTDEDSSVASIAPKKLSDAQAAGFLIPYHTGHGGLVQRGKLEAGETLLVLGGAGSSGSAAIQIGKAVGATVIAVAGNAEKEEFCKTLGADFSVNYRQGPIHEQVLSVTSGKGADVIYDPVGGTPANDALKAIAHDGRHVLIGFAAGSWAKCDPGDMVVRSYSAVGAFMAKRTPQQVTAAKSDLANWVEQGLVSPAVDHIFDFEDVPRLMKRLGNGEMLGKMVLRGVSEE